MRIAQIVLPHASQYERKSQRADFAALSEKHEVTLIPLEAAASTGAQLAHIYGPAELPLRELTRFPLPYLANAAVPKSRWPWHRAPQPALIISPLAAQPVPEAVEDAYFAEAPQPPTANRQPPTKIIASYRRPGSDDFLQRTLSRIERFRNDVEWHLYENPPTPADLASVDLWVDPALSENDFDGFVAEALVVGTAVVAGRNAINSLRLERGRTGFLVPMNDPNEMTHAILAALFKPEVAQSRLQAARQTRSKFRSRQRSRILVQRYESLIS
ncbi:MAG: hypothetical protein QOH21_3756 [Acidobacteriota bacterium]|nr:hypothetical protein [Acidobacteriota bacterium]